MKNILKFVEVNLTSNEINIRSVLERIGINQEELMSVGHGPEEIISRKYRFRYYNPKHFDRNRIDDIHITKIEYNYNRTK